MDSVLAFLVFGTLTFLVLSWPRITSKGRLTRRLYRHVDDTLGARKFENDRRASRRRLLGFFSRDLANLVYPPAQMSGAAALPGMRRIRRYVQIIWTTNPPVWFRKTRLFGLPLFWPQPWRVWHIDGAVLHWTSEAAANGANFVEWLERGKPQTGGGLAQALGREWNSHLFDSKLDYSHSKATFVLTRAERVPERIDAADDLGAFADDD